MQKLERLGQIKKLVTLTKKSKCLQNAKNFNDIKFEQINKEVKRMHERSRANIADAKRKNRQDDTIQKILLVNVKTFSTPSIYLSPNGLARYKLLLIQRAIVNFYLLLEECMRKVNITNSKK